MNALVVYESMFGNTEAIAQAVGEGLAPTFAVTLVGAGTAAPALPDDLSLLVVGAPTHRFGLSRADSRLDAARRVDATKTSPDTGLREWLQGLPAGGVHVDAAAFDTCVASPGWVRHLGRAGRVATARLRRKGGRIVATPESFFVTGMAGPLRDDEIARARRWAAQLAARVAPHVDGHAA